MGRKKKRYRLICEAKQVSGHQVYELEAYSEHDALARYHAGEGRCVEEELEVGSVGDIEVEEITE